MKNDKRKKRREQFKKWADALEQAGDAVQHLRGRLSAAPLSSLRSGEAWLAALDEKENRENENG